MATSFTLATLTTALLDLTEEVSGSAFDNKVNEIIQRAEDRLLLDLNFEIWDAWDSVTFINGTRTVTLPTGFLDLRKLYYTAASAVNFLEERTQDYILDYWPSTTSVTTAPKFWAPYSSTQIIVGGTPGATPASGTANGTKRPNSLVTDTTGTWLSQNVGSLLLQSSAIESMKQLIADERLPVFAAEYQDLLTKAQRQFAHLLRAEFRLGGMPAKQ